jgi:NAD(P)-dependent dehydrogenase (short-subunit alcohol dehydrogenase family)
MPGSSPSGRAGGGAAAREIIVCAERTLAAPSARIELHQEFTLGQVEWPGRGAAALERLAADAPVGRAELVRLDLADLASVESFSAGFMAGGEGLDLLVNNAGVMAIPHRETTAQGYERQFGINHLGHFALTGRLLPALARRPGSRVVTVTSNLHRRASGIGFDDLQAERGYRPWPAYEQSKLANAMFVLELGRRLRAAGLDVVSAGAHPGFAATNLQVTGPRSGGGGLAARGMGLATRLFAQPARDGALPVLYAATAENVHGGEYFGPDGQGEMRGHNEAGAVLFGRARRGCRGPPLGRVGGADRRHVRGADRALTSRRGNAAITPPGEPPGAGISVGSLYRFFPDRDSIVEALLFGLARRFRPHPRSGSQRRSTCPAGRPRRADRRLVCRVLPGRTRLPQRLLLRSAEPGTRTGPARQRPGSRSPAPPAAQA